MNHTNNTVHTHYVNDIYIYIILTIILPCFCSIFYFIFICYYKKNKSIYYPLINVIIKNYNTNKTNEPNEENEINNNSLEHNDNDSDIHIINNIEEDLCSICLEKLEYNIVKTKVCNHLFHIDCGKRFISNNIKHCPICRKYLYNDR